MATELYVVPESDTLPFSGLSKEPQSRMTISVDVTETNIYATKE